MVVRAHLEESASGLRAGCSLRTMKPSICVIGTLGGIKVSLHWGGLFGVRESEELISGRTSGGSENNDFGRLQRSLRRESDFHERHFTFWPSPYPLEPNVISMHLLCPGHISQSPTSLSHIS